MDGTRAVGTYIPASSIVYKTVMSGRTYYGRAWVVNAWYKTAYEPILDGRRQVIGVLYVGEKETTHIVNNNYEIVDKIRDRIGGTATIFQLKTIDRSKASDQAIRAWQGDQAMFRISTNVKKRNGDRAIGTIVSKPVYDTVMRGKTFFGRAWVVNDWYTTAYEPLKGPDGDIIGILYVGVRESEYQAVLLDQLSNTVIGKRGHIMILNEQGEYVLSPNKKADGKNMLNALDEDGKPYFIDILQQSKKLPAGKTALAYYTWKGETDSQSEEKLVGFMNFKGWKWTIVASTYVDGFTIGLNRIAMMTFIISLGAILLGIMVSYFISSSFIRPINQIIGFIDGLRDCRFSNRLEIDSRDEIGIVANALNTMVESLEKGFSRINEVIGGLEKGDLTREIPEGLQGDLDEIRNRLNTSIRMFRKMIGQVAITADEFNSRSEDMAGQANELSAGSSQQAAGIEEIASSMVEVGAQAKSSDENAIQTQELVDRARNEVNIGNGEMEAMINTMHNIQNASEKVSKVIEVINGIAAKTELLALNAAVEAARAGASGKGFAVVADEIRNLANRSSDAAKDTASLIRNSLEEVENGVQMTDRTAQALASIDQSVNQISEVIQMISQGSQDQTHSIDEISKALAEVNIVVQNNTSIAEQTAESSMNLSGQASELKGKMGQFKL